MYTTYTYIGKINNTSSFIIIYITIYYLVILLYLMCALYRTSPTWVIDNGKYRRNDLGTNKQNIYVYNTCRSKCTLKFFILLWLSLRYKSRRRKLCTDTWWTVSLDKRKHFTFINPKWPCYYSHAHTQNTIIHSPGTREKVVVDRPYYVYRTTVYDDNKYIYYTERFTKQAHLHVFKSLRFFFFDYLKSTDTNFCSSNENALFIVNYSVINCFKNCFTKIYVVE